MTLATVWLLDAPIYVFRAWFGMPDNWHDANGRSLNAVIGFSNTVLSLLEDISPQDLFFAAFDESLGTNYRNEIYSDYKISRTVADQELIFQFETCKEILSQLGITSFFGPRYEADDYIATLSEIYLEANYKIRIVTRDKDLSQLISGKKCVCFDPVSGKETDEAVFKKEFLISPLQLPDFIGLVGDSVDDIPGIPGIGRKTAVALLCEYGSLEGLKEHMNKGGDFEIRAGRRIKQLLMENWENAVISRQLARLSKVVPELDVDLGKKKFRSAANFEGLERLLIDWNAPGTILARCNKMALKFS